MKQRISSYIICFLFFLVPLTAQEVKLPSTTAGQRLADYLKAYNSNDDRQMREYFANHVAPEALERRPVGARLQVFREMRDEFGNFELRRVTQASDSSVTIIVRTAKGGWLEIGFECEPQPPHKLLGLRVEDTEPPDERQPQTELKTGPLTEKEALAEMEKYLDEQAKADNFSGVALLAKGGQPVFQKTYGLASKEFGVPNRLDTKFNLGSINKLFTQLAIGQLVEQGKLSYDDKLGKHLPDYPNRDAAEKVTIHPPAAERTARQILGWLNRVKK
jgi:hypothetical protein